jgi:hypothetical protein
MGGRLASTLMLGVVLLGLSAGWGEGSGGRVVMLASTIGPIDAGIVGALEDAFARATGIEVRHVGAGTAAALEMAKTGSFDLVMAHARALEDKFVADLEPATIQAWMDSMAAADLALGTMRIRQSTLSSLCTFLAKRGYLDTNPVDGLDRPPHRREAPRQVPGSAIMDTLVKAAQQRQRPRDLAIFLILATRACGGSQWPLSASAT